jgi:hypothetical protein
LHGKNEGAVNSWDIAFSSEVNEVFYGSLMMELVRATCGFSGGAKVLYPLNCFCRRNEGFPSSSSLGSGQFAMQKACATQSLVV